MTTNGSQYSLKCSPSLECAPGYWLISPSGKTAGQAMVYRWKCRLDIG